MGKNVMTHLKNNEKKLVKRADSGIGIGIDK